MSLHFLVGTEFFILAEIMIGFPEIMIVLAGKILQLEETNQILKSSVDSL
jgi:hypothetical protein